jgi:hypothetical protein
VPGAGVVLIKPGEGELTVAPEVLKVLDLRGKVVRGDALSVETDYACLTDFRIAVRNGLLGLDKAEKMARINPLDQ